ncbi:MAG: hypothetical protein HKO66_04970 [Saprospiraceae bacterium]|nr:hypothetical protein [Saprospiraceae bacterium]
MKKLCQFLFLLFSMTSINAQVDWKAYNEPDGTFERLFVSPSISFDSQNSFNNIKSEFNFETDGFYNHRKVSELSIQEIRFSPEVNIQYLDQEELGLGTQTNYSLLSRIDYNLTKYLKERRGLFVGASVNSFVLLRNEIDGINRNSDFQELSLSLGKGRLENVSTVYQAIRIQNQTQADAGYQQDRLFSLADVLRTNDYNNKLDSRYRSIENTTNALNELEAIGIPLSTHYEIVNAIDALRFERPSLIYNGLLYQAGVRSNIEIENEDVDFLAFGEFRYHKAINQKWHWSNNFEASYNLTEDIYNINNAIAVSYFPTGRTLIQFKNAIGHRSFEFTDATITSINNSLSIRYFVSPELSIFGNINSNLNYNNSNISDTKSFNSNIGFRYFFI